MGGNQCADAWTHADWIQIAMILVTFFVGAIGSWFVLIQNKMFQRQNEIMDKQNSQTEILISLQIAKEKESTVMLDSKFKFLRTNGQAGLLQMAAADLRSLYPNELKTILRAYAEIASVDSRFARVESFLSSIRMYRGHEWPDYP